jgi:hypothetical protein
MKFYHFLNEQQYTIDEINNLIQKDCKYYLSLINHGAIFTRAVSSPVSFPFLKKQTRQDRRAKGMPGQIFDLFNKWLKENSHLRRDNVAIASSHENVLKTNFGNNYYIFPIGKFNFTYAETNDINENDRRTGWYDIAVDDYMKHKETDLPKPFEQYFHTNKKIHIAYDLKYEIWFDCKEYYLASIAYYKWDKKEHKLRQLL